MYSHLHLLEQDYYNPDPEVNGDGQVSMKQIPVKQLDQYIENETAYLDALRPQLESAKTELDFDKAQSLYDRIKLIDNAIEKLKLYKMKKEINKSNNKNDKSNTSLMATLRAELEKEMAIETQVYREKYETYKEKQEEQIKDYELELDEELDKTMKYESPNYLKLKKEFEVVMKKNDFTSAKKISQEIERVMKEDQKILESRKAEKKKNLIKKFKIKLVQEIDHFNASYNTKLIEIQRKWDDKIDLEKKKMNYRDLYKDKYTKSMISDQNIAVGSTEPAKSIKARVNPKTKTNLQISEDLKNGITLSIQKKRQFTTKEYTPEN